MVRETINASDFLNIVAVKTEGRIKRYEVTPIFAEGFYRISEDITVTGKVYFPGKWKIEEILADITRVVNE